MDSLIYILYQYFSSPVFMTVSILVNKLDNCFVVHLLEPAMKRCFRQLNTKSLHESIVDIDNVFRRYLTSGLLYFRVLTIRLLLFYFVSAAEFHCLDLI